MFDKGNNAWANRKKYCGGRLSKEQYAKLSGLVPTALECWEEILKSNDKKWINVKAKVAGDILNKFVADLNEVSGELGVTGADLLGEFLASVRTRTGKDSEGLPIGSGDSGNKGVV